MSPWSRWLLSGSAGKARRSFWRLPWQEAYSYCDESASTGPVHMLRSFCLISILSTSLGAQAPAVERLRITPAVRTVTVGDSLRLVVQPLDARGNPVAGATVRFNAQGGRFQGAVDSLGWVRAGSPGTVPIAITAIVPGGRPVVEKIEVRITPGPTTRVVRSEERRV